MFLDTFYRLLFNSYLLLKPLKQYRTMKQIVNFIYWCAANDKMWIVVTLRILVNALIILIILHFLNKYW
jgi:hypothetical protein